MHGLLELIQEWEGKLLARQFELLARDMYKVEGEDWVPGIPIKRG